jgi:beta-glucosidase
MTVPAPSLPHRVLANSHPPPYTPLRPRRALQGDVNPSGKLPVSFPTAVGATWLGAVPNTQWPGVDTGKGWREVSYSEQLLVGYRWFDATSTAPLWPFGHGLSYTTFTYSGLSVAGKVSPTSNATVTLTVANTGARAGAEVVQLYVAFPASAGEPPKQLRGFEKLELAVGGKAAVTFTLTAADVSVWDVTADNWALVPGNFHALVGSSSRDIRLQAGFVVTPA